MGKVDPVTRSIEIVVNYFRMNFDVQFWSQHISFLLVGIIVITSIRGLLITLTKVCDTFFFNYFNLDQLEGLNYARLSVADKLDIHIHTDLNVERC